MFPSWIARLFRISSRPSRRNRPTARRLPIRTFRPSLEALEARTLLSVTPVSIASGGSTMGNQPSSTTLGTVSANRQYEVFTSSATDLVKGVTVYGNPNVYRRDLVHGTTSLVSVDSTGKAGAANGDSAWDPAITPDGRYVVFGSNDDNLTGSGNMGFSPELFVRDMTQGKTYLVASSYDTFGNVPTIGESNGQLAFAYSADSNSNEQVYVATLQLNATTGDIQINTLKTTLVSADSSGKGGNATSYTPSSARTATP